MRNGRGPAGDPGEEGGAIRSRGAALTALRVSFVANSAGTGSSGSMGGGAVGGGGAGGAIASRPGIAGAPSLTVTDSSFVGNRAGDGGLFSGPGGGNGGDGGRGGAIEVEGGTATIARTTFSGNLAGGGGGGGAGRGSGPGGRRRHRRGDLRRRGGARDHHEHLRGQPRRRRRAHGRRPVNARQGRRRRRHVRQLERHRGRGVLDLRRQPPRARILRRCRQRRHGRPGRGLRSWPTLPRPART